MRLALVPGAWRESAAELEDREPTSETDRGEYEAAARWASAAGYLGASTTAWSLGGVNESAPAVGARGAASAVSGRGTPSAAHGAAQLSELLSGCNVAWCHALPVDHLSATERAALGGWVARGNGLLLTLDAASWGLSIGDRGPALSIARGPWRDEDDPHWPAGFRSWPDYPHVRGFQGWRSGSTSPHPLLRDFQGGAFTWRASAGEPVARVVLPTNEAESLGARVVAVDRAYVQLLHGVAVAWEFDVGQGRILCLGANVCLTMRDQTFAAHRDQVLGNALRYLAERPRTTERMYWPARTAHARVTLVPAPVAIETTDDPGAEQGSERPRGARPGRSASDVGSASAFATIGSPSPTLADGAGRAFVLAGTRALVVGTDAAGIRDIWIHPLCLVSGGISYDVALDVEHVRVTPGDCRRELSGAGVGRWTERVVVSPDRPAVHFALAPVEGAPTGDGLELTFALPLRLAWPVAAHALQPLRAELRRRGDAGAVLVTGRDGAHVALIRVDGARELALTDSTESPRLSILTGDRTLSLCVSAGGDGVEALVRHPAGSLGLALGGHAARIAEVVRNAPAVATPLPALDESFRWSVQRLATFRAQSPHGAGHGLLAGFAATQPGWGVSRAGYAWFFGRDACWCIDALLASGQFSLARESLDLLARTADITGKIVHELTLSGVAHYDAADATPLFLRAVAAYAEWTGDLRAVRGWWPAVERAFAFVVSTDRDGDGLPENTGVGHGWIEDGPLGGGAVTSYVAAIWIDALRRLVRLATCVGPALRPAVLGALGRAEAGLAGLRSGPGRRLALHRESGGALLDQITALSALPVALGVEGATAAHLTMDGLAQPAFTTPWGLRLLPNDHPHYAPRAYHAGSAWPLFTGWAALADFALGRGERGLERLRANARALGLAAFGAFPEVLDGDTGAAAGVCPDQAWSAAMVIAPLVGGLFGVRPVAYEGRCDIAPCLPRDWPAMRLGGDDGGLRIGESRLEIAVTRDETSARRVTARCTSGPALALDVHPFATT